MGEVTSVEVMARDYMSWSKPELCRALAHRVNELKRVNGCYEALQAELTVLGDQLKAAQQLAMRQAGMIRKLHRDPA